MGTRPALLLLLHHPTPIQDPRMPVHKFPHPHLLRHKLQQLNPIIQQADRARQEARPPPRHHQRPAILLQARAVEGRLLPRRRRGAQEHAKARDQGEVVGGGEGPGGAEMHHLESVDKVHGGDEARFCGGAADVREVGVVGVVVGGAGGRGGGDGGCGAGARADDAAVQGDFSGEVGEVQDSVVGGVIGVFGVHLEGGGEAGKPVAEVDLDGLGAGEDYAEAVGGAAADGVFGDEGVEA